MYRAMRSDNDRPLAVDVPRAADDRPQWIKIGVIAAVGFVVGIAWPRLTGVRLGPSAPGDSPPATAGSAAPRPNDAASSTPAPVAVPAVLASASAASTASHTASHTASLTASPTALPGAATNAVAASAAGPPKMVVSRGIVVACKTEQGEALKGSKDCGALPGFDALAQPRIRRIKDCSAVEGATGKLVVTFGVDFSGNRVDVAIGKASNLSNIESIGACVKQQFAGLSLGAVDHEHPRYTVSYTTTLSPPDAAPSVPAGPAAPSVATSSAPSSVSTDAPTASVVWEVAIVRDAPRTGQVVSRLQRGAKVRVGQGQDNWYRVRYGGGFSGEGWVYRGAIGK
jgi:hypothetical protein